MRVKELIEKLQEFPDDNVEIGVYDDSDGLYKRLQIKAIVQDQEYPITILVVDQREQK